MKTARENECPNCVPHRMHYDGCMGAVFENGEITVCACKRPECVKQQRASVRGIKISVGKSKQRTSNQS